MKKIIVAAFALALLAPLAAEAQEAEVTGNVGYVSDYYFRGIPQAPSSASAGLDVAVGGLYLGTWAADVDDGNEVDLYAGYGLDIEDFSVSVGGTGYFYTDEFDDTYLEANFGAGYGPVSVEFSIGTYDTEPESASYTFLGLTLEQSGFYGTFGTFGDEFEGEYFEAGYGFSTAELDFGVSWIYSTEDLIGDDEHKLIFGVGKTFDIG